MRVYDDFMFLFIVILIDLVNELVFEVVFVMRLEKLFFVLRFFKCVEVDSFSVEIMGCKLCLNFVFGVWFFGV